MNARRMFAAAVLGLLATGGIGAAQDAPNAAPKPKLYVSCPVLSAHREAQMKAVPVKVNGLTLYACNDVTGQMLKKDPLKLLSGEVADPVTKKMFQIGEQTPWVVRDGALYLFSNKETRDAFSKDPTRYTPRPGR